MGSFSVKYQRRTIKNRFYDIPDDTLYIIFEKIDKKSDQDSFGLTCHRFLDIQNSCRKHLRILPLSGDLDNVVDYSFILDKLVNRFRQLQTISLRKCHSLTDDALNIVTESCKSLILLDICWCTNITDVGIGYINRNCRQLKALHVSGCHKILGRTFQGFLPTLYYLDATHCAFDSSGLASILSFGSLRYLNLSFLRYELDVVGLGFGSKLRILNLSGCNRATEDAIIEISQACPLLRDWNLSGCHNIRIPGWESIGLYCQNLETLDVKNCGGIDDAGLEALANGCTRLLVLHVNNYCNGITRSGIHYFKKRRRDVELYYELYNNLVVRPQNI